MNIKQTDLHLSVPFSCFLLPMLWHQTISASLSQNLQDKEFDAYTYQAKEILDTLELFIQMRLRGDKEAALDKPSPRTFTVRSSSSHNLGQAMCIIFTHFLLYMWTAHANEHVQSSIRIVKSSWSSSIQTHLGPPKNVLIIEMSLIQG